MIVVRVVWETGMDLHLKKQLPKVLMLLRGFVSASSGTVI